MDTHGHEGGYAFNEDQREAQKGSIVPESLPPVAKSSSDPELRPSEGSEEGSEPPITWHFVGGRGEAVSCLQIALQETNTGWADWFALQQARKMFHKIQELHDGQTTPTETVDTHR